MNYKNPDFLKNHIKSIISFYHPSCIDNEFGGYINQFRDDGNRSTSARIRFAFARQDGR